MRGKKKRQSKVQISRKITSRRSPFIVTFRSRTPRGSFGAPQFGAGGADRSPTRHSTHIVINCHRPSVVLRFPRTGIPRSTTSYWLSQYGGTNAWGRGRRRPRAAPRAARTALCMQWPAGRGDIALLKPGAAIERARCPPARRWEDDTWEGTRARRIRWGIPRRPPAPVAGPPCRL